MENQTHIPFPLPFYFCNLFFLLNKGSGLLIQRLLLSTHWDGISKTYSITDSHRKTTHNCQSKSSLSERAIHSLVHMLRNTAWASTKDNDSSDFKTIQIWSATLGNTVLCFQGLGHDETKNWSIQGYLLKGFYSAQLPDHTGKGHAPASPLSFSRKQDVSQVSIFLTTHSPCG